MGEDVIRINKLRKVYRMGDEKIVAINNVSLNFIKGEICCLLGTSGSGKSTLLNLISGLEKPTKGEIIIHKKHIERMNEDQLAKFRQEYIGFVFQSYNLLGTLTALENVTLPLIFKKVPVKERKERAMEMLKAVGLEDRANHKPSQMSGGQQQRVSIARALAKNPKLLLCDEPTGALDYNTGKSILKLLQDTCRKMGMTVIVITHNSAIAPMADRIIHIKNGKVSSMEQNEHPVPVETIEW